MDSAYYSEYYILERNHWWFKARLEILKSQISKIRQKSPNTDFKILNVGVATGATSYMLEEFGDVVSVEFDSDCCKFLRSELKMDVIEASLTELPFDDNSFDLICAFDVIEHIEDDSKALQEICRVMKPNGAYSITVPAFQFLWGDHDVINHHFRRYTRRELNSKIVEAKLKPRFQSYFNFWLFPPIAIVRIIQNLIRKPNRKIESDFQKQKGNALVNKILFGVFLSEKLLLKLGLRLPFGVSIMSTGSKNT